MNRSERRHHARRLKAKRCRYNNSGDGSPAAVGMVARTPCLCSCWMCGHQREHHGPNMQERRAAVRNTD